MPSLEKWPIDFFVLPYPSHTLFRNKGFALNEMFIWKALNFDCISYVPCRCFLFLVNRLYLKHFIGTSHRHKPLISEECLSTYLVPNTVWWFMREHNFFWFLFHPFWLWILCFKSRRSPCVCVFLFTMVCP